MLLFLLLSTGAYAYGLAVEADALLDGSPSAVFQVNVLNKWVSNGRFVISWHIQLGPCGPRQDVSDVSVLYSLYKSIQIGGRVCVNLRPGALGIPWYYLKTCR